MLRIVFACLCTLLLYAQNELFVHLHSDLFPTHIALLEGGKTPFSCDYLKELESVLYFDIGNNGMNRLLTKDEQTNIIPFIGESLDLPKLRQAGLAYLVEWKIVAKEIVAKVVDITVGTARSVGPFACTGKIEQDRRKIHQLADTIHQILFGRPGIANTHILFVTKRKLTGLNGEPQYASEIFKADYDGHNAIQLTSSRSLCATPLFVPKAPFLQPNIPDHFLYVSYELGQPKMYTAQLHGGNPRRVSHMRGNQLTPALSKDGSQLAFCSDILGTADLYLVSFEPGVGAIGKPRQIFHVRGTATGCPCFSPDGKRIAFVSNKDACPRIYVMNIPETGVKSTEIKPMLISKKCRNNTAPTWSPDGKKIAYSARNDGDREIWVYDFEREIEEQITEGAGSKESPCWAPDSLHLVYHAYTKTGCELYITNLHQRTSVKISSGPHDKLFAVWEPVSI